MVAVVVRTARVLWAMYNAATTPGGVVGEEAARENNGLIFTKPLFRIFGHKTTVLSSVLGAIDRPIL